MDSRHAATGITDSDAIEFVRFCYRRRRVGWPELYDEMCAVASRGLFRGYDADDLAGLGIGFSLFGMPALAVLSTQVVAEEQALRRPVAVMIKADPAVASGPAAEVEAPSAMVSAVAPATVAPAPAIVSAVAPAIAPATLTPQAIHESREGRTFDVPIRLALVPSGA
ncbi:MAG: hypothetical protein QOE66_1909 [Chloroflexota bacterium]|nr:hypothetical protein [Chloroflexota bacterium]